MHVVTEGWRLIKQSVLVVTAEWCSVNLMHATRTHEMECDCWIREGCEVCPTLLVPLGSPQESHL